MKGPWTTAGDVEAKVRRRWDDGTLLRHYATNAAFETIEVAVRGPKPSEIGDDLAAVRDWVARLDAERKDDRRFTLRWHSVGGRTIGRNALPVRAVVSSFDQAWALLGVRDTVRRFDEILALTAGHPPVREWVVSHPRRALEVGEQMPRLLAAYVWLSAHRGSGRYLREISAPGVDTKFAEKHRVVLAGWLGVSSTASGFLTSLGLQVKPALVRFRPAPELGFAPGASEIGMRAEELARLAFLPQAAIVVENEVTYLSVPVPERGVVIWGQGFDVDRVGRLGWLSDVEVTYWGDLDTHGFAILDRLRAWLPHVRSTLMDRSTLIGHRDRWGQEERPTRAALSRLTADEMGLYEDLVTDALGPRIRLEQERVDWCWAADRLPYSRPSPG